MQLTVATASVVFGVAVKLDEVDAIDVDVDLFDLVELSLPLSPSLSPSSSPSSLFV